MDNQMNPTLEEQRERITAWVDALKSGDYQQTTGALKDEKGYCCLGVAVDKYAKATGAKWEPSDARGYYRMDGETSSLPPAVVDWYGIDTIVYFDRIKDHDATYYNDMVKFTFDKIADMIMENYDVVISRKRFS